MRRPHTEAGAAVAVKVHTLVQATGVARVCGELRRALKLLQRCRSCGIVANSSAACATGGILAAQLGYRCMPGYVRVYMYIARAFARTCVCVWGGEWSCVGKEIFPGKKL